MSTLARSYHHGDLRAALLMAAIDTLEAGEPFSMRAVARRAGVSPAAPYRHFQDRAALDAAVAIEGFRNLRDALAATLETESADADSATVVADLAVTYVQFALHRPTVFRLMFGNECDTEDSERVQAAGALQEVLDAEVRRRFPGGDATHLAVALWSMAHGLAFLHLDGKFRPEPAEAVAARVRSAIGAVLAVTRQA